MTTSQNWTEGIVDILQEALDGGAPGDGTAFLDGTQADGSGNCGLFATLATLSAGQASLEVGGSTVAGQAQHTAFHLEVCMRWERDGERGPFDWQGSFLPAQVNDEQWREVQRRLRTASDEFSEYTRSLAAQPAGGDLTGSLTGAVAHVAYHLGSIRQLAKAVREG